MTVALRHVALGPTSPAIRSLDAIEATHGVTARAARSYERFFGQTGVRLSPLPHGAMLTEALSALVAREPGLAAVAGIGLHAKTQTHNTPADEPWLHAAFDAAGLGAWEVATVSMTNCASGLAAAHLLGACERPFVVLTGEKAFHPAGARLPAGLLGEAPACVLLAPGRGRRVRRSHVRHLPRFHINPDDMALEDRVALRERFEAELLRFLDDVAAADPTFFARRPRVVPYDLNPPLVRRVAEALGVADRLVWPEAGRVGHAFCSDVLVNLATGGAPRDAPLLLFCAGMGVTFAALTLEAAEADPPRSPPTAIPTGDLR